MAPEPELEPELESLDPVETTEERRSVENKHFFSFGDLQSGEGKWRDNYLLFFQPP